MSLAMGLAAVDEYFKEGERRELRERDRKRFGWESQRAESEMSLLGDKTEAERLGLRDRAGASASNIATRPQRTANELLTLGQEGIRLNRAGARQGTVEDTADVVANYSLGDARFKLDVLPDKAEAERLDLRDRAGASASNIATRPQRTANELLTLGQEGIRLNRAGARQGTVEDTADVVANYSLGDARFKLGQQPTLQNTQRNTNEVNLLTSANTLENAPAKLEANTNQTILGLNQSRGDLANQPARLQTETNTTNMALEQSKADVVAQPMKIAQQAAAGTVSQMQAQGQLLSNLYDAIQTGNQDIVRTYIQNSLNTGLFPSLKGKTVGEVGSIRGADGKPVIVAKDATGQVLFQMSMDELQRVRDAMAKPETLKLDGGESLVLVKGGTATPFYTAPVSPDKAADRDGKKPAEIQAAEWLVKNKIAANEAEAWKMVRASKEKSRSAFIQEFILKSAGMGDTRKSAEEAGKVWDELNGASTPPAGPRPGAATAPGAPAAGAAPARPPMDPALSRLLGISQ